MASSIDAGAGDASGAPRTVAPIAGVRLASAAAGARYQGRDDVALIELAPFARTWCVFTSNRFRAAPVIVARRNLARHRPRFLLVNAGNANAGTGTDGERRAERLCGVVAEAAGCEPEEVLPFSTGVIGERLDVEPIAAVVPRLLESLDENAWPAAAAAIMTTDTVPKLRSTRFDCAGRVRHVTGIAKGSGMIRPDMATMLAYVATDVPLSSDLVRALSARIARSSFNRITVDGDTSTNDAFALISGGESGEERLDSTDDPRFEALADALEGVCAGLARDIVRDGEGATKLVTVRVTGATEQDCARVAYTVAESPLVKTALFAGDPNWGRILAAVGRAPIGSLDLAEVRISIAGVPVVEHGELAPSYDESRAAEAMKASDLEIAIRIGTGSGSAVVWTCDLSYDYVKINAEYRS